MNRLVLKKYSVASILMLLLLVGGTLLLFCVTSSAQTPLPPQADFSVRLSWTCAPLKAFFTDLSTGTITAWQWDFGDGTTSSERNPRHLYRTGGVYTISLTVSGPDGSDTETKVDYLTIIGIPTASFTASPTSGGAPLTVSFTDRSYDAAAWQWYFGDGGFSTDENPTYTYHFEGTFVVTLIAVNECGSDTTTGIIAVRDPEMPPIADFNAQPTEGCYPFRVYFTDLSRGVITSWFWDFGDGFTSTAQNPVHIFRGRGPHTVTLTVTGPAGSDIETKINYITVHDMPVSNFEATPDSGAAPLTVNFTDYALDADSILWRFGDGSVSTGINNLTHTYDIAGVYTVYQVAVNNCGRDSTSKTITVTEPIPPPQAEFQYEPIPYCDSTVVNFTDFSSGPITTRNWAFGDGTFSSSQNPVHTYHTPGNYTIILIVTGPGGSDTSSKDINIAFLEYPVADFTAVPDSGGVPLIVTFTDQSAFATSWAWDFGDGQTDNIQNPTHTYTTVGIYTVQLTASNECGTDTAFATVKVTEPLEPPRADFTADTTSACQLQPVTFTDLSTGIITLWSWDFGDGGTSNMQHPRYTYSAPGSYTVTLTVSGPGGFDDTTKVNFITVKSLPTAAFNAVPDSGQVPLNVAFNDQSSDAESIFWRFGDGSTSTIPSPSHTFNTAGIYTVYQVAINECGRDSTFRIIKVTDTIPGPKADFSAEPLKGCTPLTVNFKDLSTGNITSWLWDLGNGTVSPLQNPSLVYTRAGNYTISLTVSGPGGIDKETKDYYITVKDVPTVAFIAEPLYGEPPLQVTFTNLSVDADSVLWRFGDGKTSEVFNPVHLYDNIGVYQVTLVAINDCGRDSLSDFIVVDRRTGELTLSKLVNRPYAEVDETLTYFLSLTNTGDETVYSVVVGDTIPNYTTYIPGSASGDGAIVYNSLSHSLTWSLDSLAVGQSRVMQLQVTVNENAPNGHTIVNRASIIGPPPYSGWAEASTTILAPDIALTKQANPNVAKPGDTVLYTVRAVNNGDSPLPGAYLIDNLPDEFIYITGTGEVNNAAAVVSGMDPIRVEIGDIGIRDSAVITYRVAISASADTGATYRNAATLFEGGGSTRLVQNLASRSWGPVYADVSLITPPLLIRKTADKSSAAPGDIVPYLLTIQNTSPVTAYHVMVIDTLPSGFIYIPSTSVINDLPSPDPVGDNPYQWSLGTLSPGATATIRYTVQLGTRTASGVNDNVAWAHADSFRPSRATARIQVMSEKFNGTIRGRIMVDCDGDGIADIDSVPVGVDIFLDDGYQSRSNDKGMFYFSAVRAGEHAVKIDRRDLKTCGYYLPEGVPEAVFVHVHEMSEAYVLFRICPEQPVLTLDKRAAVIPKVRVTKTAHIDTTMLLDTTGVTVDYTIDIASNGGADPTLVRVVDSLPDRSRLIIDDAQLLAPVERNQTLCYELTFGQNKIRQSAQYSLEDLAPGLRRFMSNKIHLEDGRSPVSVEKSPLVSNPAEIAVGPFKLSPPAVMQFNLIGAYFETARAQLLPEALPTLNALADSIRKYDNVEVKAEGHCDYRRVYIAYPSNWELSIARAKAVIDWLIANGIDSTIMSYEGFAATRPVDTGHTPEAWAKNRRVEVFLKGKKGPVIDIKNIPVNEWQGSTLLELTPVNWDTLIVSDNTPLEKNFNDNWEIRLTVENIGRRKADKVMLNDILPANTEYIDGSARVDNLFTPAIISHDNKIQLEFGPVEPGQKIRISYRFRAVSDKVPDGGGAAELRTIDPDSPREYKSNPVLFQ